ESVSVTPSSLTYPRSTHGDATGAVASTGAAVPGGAAATTSPAATMSSATLRPGIVFTPSLSHAAERLGRCSQRCKTLGAGGAPRVGTEFDEPRIRHRGVCVAGPTAAAEFLTRRQA